jgi:hypothetical protein
MSVIDILNDRQVTQETLLEAMTTSVYECSGDKTRSEMLRDLEGAVGSKKAVDEMLASLEGNSELVHEAALAWLSAASGDSGKSNLVAEAIQNSDRNAVLLETTAVAVISLYALYLIATGGKANTAHTIEVKPDGTYVETEKVVYERFSETLKAFFDAIMKNIDPSS